MATPSTELIAGTSFADGNRKDGKHYWLTPPDVLASLVYPIPKWVLMLIEAGAEVRNLGDVKWCATEDGTPGPGIGQHVACFVFNAKA